MDNRSAGGVRSTDVSPIATEIILQFLIRNTDDSFPQFVVNVTTKTTSISSQSPSNAANGGFL